MNSKLFLLPIMAMLFASAMGQSKIYVWQNGQATPFNVASVDSITFIEENDKIPVANAMPSDAKTLAAKIHTGINIGNTLEAVGDWCNDYETCWGAAPVTQGLLDAYKKAGFNAVRIPVAWHSHESNSETYQIDPAWMARIKEVVNYAMNADLYTIINIHWDNGWLEKNCTKAKQESVNKEQEALWRQIATTFRDYDERLLFASANEPDINDEDKSRGSLKEQADVLKSYHQTFVNTVRTTGGNNALRNLIVQAPSTSIDKAIEYDVVPSDIVPNRIMMEVHFYPYSYALMEEDASWDNTTASGEQNMTIYTSMV